jgi:hypothetical protein
LRISMDTKATVHVGEYSRRGQSRGFESVKALDHDISTVISFLIERPSSALENLYVSEGQHGNTSATFHKNHPIYQCGQGQSDPDCGYESVEASFWPRNRFRISRSIALGARLR